MGDQSSGKVIVCTDQQSRVNCNEKSIIFLFCLVFIHCDFAVNTKNEMEDTAGGTNRVLISLCLRKKMR
jgi:hypothetical protein